MSLLLELTSSSVLKYHLSSNLFLIAHTGCRFQPTVLEKRMHGRFSPQQVPEWSKRVSESSLDVKAEVTLSQETETQTLMFHSVLNKVSLCETV